MLEIETRRVFAAAAIALRYPEREWLRTFEEIENDLVNFAPETKERLWDLLSYFGSKSIMDLQIDYVNTFDRKRRACLYMSYYLNGDTRRRGMALLNFKDVFASEGWKSTSDELDDFLPILLEFIAVTASPAGLALLQEHKAGVALLEIALRDMKSPYSGLIKEVHSRIPGEDTSLTLQLIESGPPAETVGLSGYGEKFTESAGAKC
jgi:nitrate reductase molybdenum cofactor assembly chaperone NarJ/NarW